MDWAQILVIILAVMLTVLLIVAIALGVLMLKLTRQIKQATASAERTMHAIEDSVTNFNKTTLPFMAAKSIIGRVIKSRRKKKGETHEKE